jgi:hypothetical protein
MIGSLTSDGGDGAFVVVSELFEWRQDAIRLRFVFFGDLDTPIFLTAIGIIGTFPAPPADVTAISV